MGSNEEHFVVDGNFRYDEISNGLSSGKISFASSTQKGELVNGIRTIPSRKNEQLGY